MTFVVLRLSSLGDVVLASGVPGALKQAGPDTRVIFVTKRAFVPVAEMMPGVDEVISYPGSILKVAGFIRRIKPEGVLDLQGSFRTLALKYLTGPAKFYRIKNASLERRLAVRDHRRLAGLKARSASYEGPVNKALENKYCPEAVPELKIPAEAMERADEILARLKGPSPILAIVPGSLWATKQWPVESFAKAVLSMKDKARVLVLGTESEAGLTARVAQAAGVGALDLGGRTDLKLAAALLARCQTALTNDSGLMHLAEAVGTPVVALFGSTVPELGFRPWRPESQVLGVDLTCRPCHVHGRKACPLGHFKCMKDLGVDRVIEACDALLSRRAAT